MRMILSLCLVSNKLRETNKIKSYKHNTASTICFTDSWRLYVEIKQKTFGCDRIFRDSWKILVLYVSGV